MKKLFIILAILVGGILALSWIGNIFISEITKEVNVEKRNDITDARIGNPAPYFELPDLNGPKVKITYFIGKPLVIVFWASWNEESADQIKILDDFVRHPKFDIDVISVNSQEDKSAVLNFILRGNYKVKVLLDETGEATEKYNARSLPTAYFLDKDGIIREIFIGILSEKMLVEKMEKLLKY